MMNKSLYLSFLIALTNLAFISGNGNDVTEVISSKEAKVLREGKEKPLQKSNIPKQGTALWHYVKGAEEIMGRRTPHSAAIANAHFERAAAMGYVPAIKALADSYFSGDGIEKNREKAMELYKTAADKGDGSAQFNLGIIYYMGYVNAHKDLEKAFYYLCLASMNKDLDEMEEDAAEYRDKVDALLTPMQKRQVFIMLAKKTK